MRRTVSVGTVWAGRVARPAAVGRSRAADQDRRRPQGRSVDNPGLAQYNSRMDALLHRPFRFGLTVALAAGLVAALVLDERSMASVLATLTVVSAFWLVSGLVSAGSGGADGSSYASGGTPSGSSSGSDGGGFWSFFDGGGSGGDSGGSSDGGGGGGCGGGGCGGGG